LHQITVAVYPVMHRHVQQILKGNPIMKIAVTSSEKHLDAEADPRFGRCRYFLIIDTDTLEYESLENSNVALGSGAGIQSARQMAEKGVKFILTGNCGPKAYQTLSAAGIGVIVGCSGLIRDLVEQFKAGKLTAAETPNVASHFGMSGGPEPEKATPQQSPKPKATGGGMGMGRGGGRGMGKGMGRGMGRGMGMGAGFPSAEDPESQPPSRSLSKKDELNMLKQQAGEMTQEIQQIRQRIRQLEQEE